MTAFPLSDNQETFAYVLAKNTGLNLNVVRGWLAQEQPEENANPAQDGLYNFLNVGITGSANYGATDSIWKNPVTAAEATASWLKGSASAVPGYSAASNGIQGILSTTSDSPAQQITAIQQSGWAKSGEPSLPALYTEASGSPLTQADVNAIGSAVISAPAGGVSGVVQGLGSAVGDLNVPNDVAKASTAAVNAAGNAIGGAFTSIWQSFIQWIPKAALTAGLVLAALGLFYVALMRGKGQVMGG